MIDWEAVNLLVGSLRLFVLAGSVLLGVAIIYLLARIAWGGGR